MAEKSFDRLADEALEDTRRGLDLLKEIDALQRALRNLADEKEFGSMVKEIIEKEKLAVGFVQQSTIATRNLMQKQQEEIERLIERLN